MSFISQKKRALLMFVLVCTMLLSFMIPPERASAQLLMNFGGYLADVDYQTCNCGFIIFSVYDNQTRMTYRIIFPYLAQLLEKLGVDFGWLGMFVPRLYEYYMIIPGYEVNVLGNFFPYKNAVCLTFCQNGCCVVQGYDGYLINMGTSMFPSIN